MLRSAIEDIVDELTHVDGDVFDQDFCPSESIEFVVAGLRSQCRETVLGAVRGLLKIVRCTPQCIPCLREAGVRLACAHLIQDPQESAQDVEEDDGDGSALLSKLAYDLLSELKGGGCDEHRGAVIREFNFCGTASKTQVELRLRLGSFNTAGVGWKVWPSASILSQWLVDNPQAICGMDVLEVGAGPGLCGFVAARLGSRRCVLSDFASHVVELLAANCVENKFETGIEVRALNWENSDLSSDDQYDVILASDVLYAHDAALALPVFLQRHLRSGVGRFYACCPAARENEGNLPAFLARSRELGLICTRHELAHDGPNDQDCTFLFLNAPSVAAIQ